METIITVTFLYKKKRYIKHYFLGNGTNIIKKNKKILHFKIQNNIRSFKHPVN